MNEETLIRQAIAEEAEQAVDPGTVLAGLREARPRRRTGMLMAVAAAAVVAAVVAIVIPLASSRDSNEPAGPPATTKPPAPAAAEQTILLAGFDGHWLTDTLILVHRRANGSDDAVSLPRDTWVRVPNYGDQRLNHAYAVAIGNNQNLDFRPNAAKVVVDTVEQLTKTHIDHYAMVDMNVFGKLAEAVGGVEVCLRTKVQDAYSGADLPAGRQVLSGGQLLAFLVFWGVNVEIIRRGIESIRVLERWAAPLLLVMGLGLFVWAWWRSCGSGTACPAVIWTGSCASRRSCGR